MEPGISFWIAHVVAFAGWGALLLGHRRTASAVAIARTCAALVAVGYLTIFLLNLRAMKVLAQDYSVDGISALFQNPNLALLGWVHYLAFDLWVGCWEAEEAERGGMPRWALVASLILTCAFGPIGLLLFLALSRGRTKKGSGS